MKKLTAAQHRYLDNATLITASELVFQGLEKAGTPRYLLSEIADTTSGGTPSRKNITYYGGAIPWIKSGELNDGLIEQAEEYITEEGLQKSSAKIYPKGTLVIALYGATVGKTGILNIDAASNQAVCAVTPRTKDVSNRFLFWFLRSKRPKFLDISFGGAQPNISQKILRETSLPIPTLQLQKQICEFLEIVEQKQVSQKLSSLSDLPPLLCDVRETVTRVEELVAKVEEARGLRSESLARTEAIINSETTQVCNSLDRYEQLRLGQLGKNGSNPIQTGPFGSQLLTSEFVSSGVPVLNVGNVKPQGLHLERLDHVTPEKATTLSRYTLQTDDLLFARTGATLGKVCLVPEGCDDWLMTGHLFRVRLDQSRCDPRFAFVALRGAESIKEQIFGQVRGATRPGFNTTLLSNVQLPLPPLAEQRQIIAHLEDLQSKVDKLKRLQSETEAELNDLLPSILDKAFKGEL